MTTIETIEFIGNTIDPYIRFHNILSLINVPYEIQSNYHSRNIIIPAKDQFKKIVLTAHHDAFYKSRGYNDNASGIAILLKFQNERPDNFEIVFTDNEEIGGLGSALYLSKNKPLCNINLDVVGIGESIFYEKYGNFKLTIPNYSEEYKYIPFNDSHIFYTYGIPSILVLTGKSRKVLIRDIWDAQHGGINDNKIEILSGKVLDKTYMFLYDMLRFNSK